MFLKYPIDMSKPQKLDYADDLLCQFQIALRCLRANKQQSYYSADFFSAFKEEEKFVIL